MEEQKIKANAVGATSSRPHFEEITKGKKGITLIALIITIIVMLILVGVTVATISDGGLFQKATTAAEKTEEKTIHEQLMAMAEFETNGKIKVKETYSATKIALESQGKKVSLKSPSTVDKITGNATIEVTEKNGKTYTYTITTEKILTGEFEFYGYGYYHEDLNMYYYFLENGLCCACIDDKHEAVIEYEKIGNEISGFGGDTNPVLSSDYSTITSNEITLIRDKSKTYKVSETQDEWCDIYVNAVYFSDATKDWFFTKQYDYEQEGTVYIWVEEDKDFETMWVGDFTEIEGAVVSTDGKQVEYNGVTYKLVER